MKKPLLSRQRDDKQATSHSAVTSPAVEQDLQLGLCSKELGWEESPADEPTPKAT